MKIKNQAEIAWFLVLCVSVSSVTRNLKEASGKSGVRTALWEVGKII